MSDGPYRSAQAPTTHVCPRCAGVALARRPIAHVAVDECPRCGGVFVARDVLAVMIDDLGLYAAVRAAFPGGGRAATTGGPFYGKCPVCEELMNRRLFADGAQVIVDVCHAHGTWFDAKELTKVIDFVERGGLEAAAAARAEPEPAPMPPETRGVFRRALEVLLKRRAGWS